MKPDRMYPKYLLAKLYDLMEDKEKVIRVAEEILVAKIKIESAATEEIKKEMEELVDKYRI